MSSVERDRPLPEVGTRELLAFLRAYRASGAFGDVPSLAPLAPAVVSSPTVAAPPPPAGADVVEAIQCPRTPGSRRSRRGLGRLFTRRS
jgi:hypothetical protein